MRYPKVISLIAMTSVLAGPLASQVRTSEIDIVAITSAGKTVEAGYVELLNPITFAPLKAHFDGLHATAIPYGDYLLRVRVPGFRNHQQPLHVYQTHVYVRIGLAISRVIDEDPQSFRGILRPAPRRGQEIWVKLVPILTGTPTMDYLVDPDGRFSFSGVNSGQYLVLVIRGEQCILSKQVSTSTSEVELIVSDQ
jgi:hypothetical protein